MNSDRDFRLGSQVGVWKVLRSQRKILIMRMRGKCEVGVKALKKEEFLFMGVNV